MEDGSAPKIGECNACGVEYEIEVYSCSGSHPDDWGYKFQKCPNCSYDPDFKKDIEEILDMGISARINSGGNSQFNSDELAEIVNKEILKMWPKGGKDE